MAWGCIGRLNVEAYLFLTLERDTGEWLTSCPSHFIPRARAPDTHSVGGWLGIRVSLDVLEKRKILTPAWNLSLDHSFCTLVTVLTKLSRLVAQKVMFPLPPPFFASDKARNVRFYETNLQLPGFMYEGVKIILTAVPQSGVSQWCVVHTRCCDSIPCCQCVTVKKDPQMCFQCLRKCCGQEKCCWLLGIKSDVSQCGKSRYLWYASLRLSCHSR